MSKRLQVVVGDAELERFERTASQSGLTLSEWVRQSLRSAERQISTADGSRKLAAIRVAFEHEFPAPDIDVMLGEIEAGYGAPD